MKVMKRGERRLFEADEKTASVVSSMLLDLGKNGMDTVCKYSRELDESDPLSFRLNDREIAEAISQVPEEAIRDTNYCQGNVRRFARSELVTLLPLQPETKPGVILGHRHISVYSVGSYIPGGRYAMFGCAEISIIPAPIASPVNRRVHAPVKGSCYYPPSMPSTIA
jgi:sulfopropanediol 3-dehydrogenase